MSSCTSHFADTFLETFQADLPDLACQNHRILIVAARLDASAERIINYLAERHGVQINAVFFKYSKLSDGKEILARSMLVADRVRPVAMTQKKNPSLDYLLGVAEEHKVGPITGICPGNAGHVAGDLPVDVRWLFSLLGRDTGGSRADGVRGQRRGQVWSADRSTRRVDTHEESCRGNERDRRRNPQGSSHGAPPSGCGSVGLLAAAQAAKRRTTPH